MTAESPAPVEPPPAHPGISRRNALLLWFGQADKVALERDQQSAIDGALGYTARAAEPEEEAAAAAPPRGLARLIPGFVRRGFTRKS
ncbi:MAG: hypothetical protein EXR95_10510 [Gemmatimonadetes bacterium]|nr:hypothetical protein [Gemmatimonadota bacterium]